MARSASEAQQSSSDKEPFQSHQHDKHKWHSLDQSNGQTHAAVIPPPAGQSRRDSLVGVLSRKKVDAWDNKVPRQRQPARRSKRLEAIEMIDTLSLDARRPDEKILTGEELKRRNQSIVRKRGDLETVAAQKRARHNASKDDALPVPMSPSAPEQPHQRVPDSRDAASKLESCVGPADEGVQPRRRVKRDRVEDGDGIDAQAASPARRKSKRFAVEAGATASKPVVIESDEEVQVLEDSLKKCRRSRRHAKQESEDAATVLLQYPLDASSVDAVPLTKGDLGRLEEAEFLNDNIVDFFLKLETIDPDLSQLLDSSLTPELVKQQLHVFSSHFYTKLHETRISTKSCADQKQAYERVERWTRGIDIFAYKYVLVPIVEHLHWSLAVICNPALLLASKAGAGAANDLAEDEDEREVPCIVFMDSLKMHKANTIHFNLRTWLCLEADKKKKAVAPDKTSSHAFTKSALPIVTPVVPLQNNGWDCGVFLLRYAHELLAVLLDRPGHKGLKITRRRVDTHFNQENFRTWFKNADIPKLRLHIKQQIQVLIEKRDANASAYASNAEAGSGQSQVQQAAEQPAAMNDTQALATADQSDYDAQSASTEPTAKARNRHSRAAHRGKPLHGNVDVTDDVCC